MYNNEKLQWRNSRESINRFIVNWTNLPLRISRTNKIQIKRKVLGTTMWVDYRAPIDIYMHTCVDSPLGDVSFCKNLIRKGCVIDLKKYVKGDIEENSSRFFGSFVRFLEDKNFM